MRGSGGLLLCSTASLGAATAKESTRTMGMLGKRLSRDDALGRRQAQLHPQTQERDGLRGAGKVKREETWGA